MKRLSKLGCLLTVVGVIGLGCGADTKEPPPSVDASKQTGEKQAPKAPEGKKVGSQGPVTDQKPLD